MTTYDEMKARLQGSMTALVTPMTADGAVDYDALARLIEWQIESGTHALVAVGTTGESATLSMKEHGDVIEFFVKQVAGRIPVIAGTGANNTAEAIELTAHAKAVGADFVLLVVPYYNKPTQEGLYQHYKTIAEAVDIPQILYNVPGRTVVDMNEDTVARLADISNIVAIKDATGDLVRGKALIERVGERLVVLSGDDPTALELMKFGAKGNISVTSNVAPKAMSEIFSLALAGKFDEASVINQGIEHLHKELFCESSPQPAKYALHKMGMIDTGIRLPLVWLSAGNQSIIDQALQKANLI
ncbi:MULTISPECIES: 4-hydroxy-tetrahydrodipicolinate synthase [Moraxella]|uniref:4-hydroxy-tetrahydrodipicolinate synthase n=1 Tax=Moraxella lacunata TaxID=477 RepID=A0A1B8Q7X0_MORLA|nr:MULTISPECIES: 4-hydroxy-tetrahydrodipicolinate synthase [Moraxella]MBE9578709.1 4-hydroxy-tetrahydrodipicolinate synthase [Moraxella sp. K1664]MBE9587958.1 4-hydroxy-tetrahydrodipicolinate synthase [Moraxella sp. K1630]MBE9590109.1 4-hydroxy-tetrahydrodipicolinate synthase [Moraxella sp. K127]MBE9596321.1 4-hydroxy-tetrahydrodipicolinate synthase [Moraxella sp. K2450]MDH9218523.1 4-hydroxy-tetrahydrodipicolinate synthase [Moraxella lacunata]